MDRNGIFLGYGNAFQKNKDIDPINIYDITPTIYHILDCSIPDDLDGKIVTDSLSQELAEKTSNYHSPQKDNNSRERAKTTPEEDESIREQLRDLGYFTV